MTGIKGYSTFGRVFFLLLIPFALFCYYDANPPSVEKLSAYSPSVAVQVYGISGKQKILFKYAENGETLKTLSSALYSSASGNFTFTYVFKENTSSANFTLIIDLDNNGEDTGDLRYQSPTIYFSSKKDSEKSMVLDASTFSTIP